MIADIISRDVKLDLRHIFTAGVKENVLQQLFKHRVQPAGADIFAGFVGTAGGFRDGLQRILIKG